MKNICHFFTDREGALYCYDTSSNSVFQVDKLMKSIISGQKKEELLKLWSSEEVEKAFIDFSSLQARGFFTEKNLQTEINKTYDFDNINLLSTSLMVSSDCNMRCIYCFNDGGTKPEDSDQVMSFEVAKQAIDYLVNNSEKEEIGCDFFGGEPLYNYKLIKHVVEYCKTYTSKKWIFSLITNGTILNDEIIEMFKENCFHIVVSYDSILQNEQRPSRCGKNLVPVIRDNIIKLRDILPRTEISIRCILTHNMCAHIKDIIEEAKELGVRVLFGPVTLEESNPLNLTDDDYAKYINIIENELVKNYSEEKYDLVTGITSLSAIILQLITGRKKYYSCGVGTDQVGISATGKIYPCHRFIGINELEMGDIYTGIDKKLYGKYTSRFVDNINPCKTCWAKYLCGGGCAHESYTYNNDLFSPNTKRCDLTKNEIEIALKIYAEAMKNGEQEKLEKIAQVIGNNSVANAHIHNSHEVV